MTEPGVPMELDRGFPRLPEPNGECDRWATLLTAYIDAVSNTAALDEGHAGGCG